jgi:MYXO-CTERM domain-containing protein
MYDDCNLRSAPVRLLTTVALLLFFSAPAAAQVVLHADTAPNIFGSPDYPGWWATTRANVIAGVHVEMASGTYAGRLEATPREEIVYSTGDLGRRLHWIYWIEGWQPPVNPDTGALDLEGRLEVKSVVDWKGLDWTANSDDPTRMVEDGPLFGWGVPTRVELVQQGDTVGVIGTFGCAWWASDDLAEPLSTPGTSPYDETDEADIEALVAEVLASQTRAVGLVRYLDDENREHIFPLTIRFPRCGDGETNGDEDCDDGLNNGSYGACDALCAGLGAHCGDDVLNGDEECDDGNIAPGDGCDERCLVEAEPGDDVGDAGDVGDVGVDASDADMGDDLPPDHAPDDTSDVPPDAPPADLDDESDEDLGAGDVPLGPDGDDDEDADELTPGGSPDGCGCSATGGDPTAALPLLALLLLFARRRVRATGP